MEGLNCSQNCAELGARHTIPLIERRSLLENKLRFLWAKGCAFELC